MSARTPLSVKTNTSNEASQVEILDRPINRIPSSSNRVINWAIRDMQPFNKSGYRRNLGSLIINKRVN
jgi:hypothetical protein